MTDTAHKLPVEFRNKTESPTERGWYYARRSAPTPPPIEPIYAYCAEGIEPYVVMPTGTNGSNELWTVDRFDWFGPVTEVREG